MLGRILGTLTGGRVETFYVENARELIKPKTFVASSWYMDEFTSRHISKHNIKSTFHISEGRRLDVHYFQNSTSPAEEKSVDVTKKAVIYMTGNCHYVAEAIPRLAEDKFFDDFEALVKKMEPTADVSFYCQDYRGRGFNQKDAKENFNDYTLFQDAKDQASLIRKLIVEDRYKPEDILVCGYSYGSAIGLWAIFFLINQYGSSYANVKIYSDRGFGNLFNYYPISFFIKDNENANQRLHQIGVMPEISLYDIAKLLPASCVFEIEDPQRDKVYLDTITLHHSFQKEEFLGRVWMGKKIETSWYLPHFTPHNQIQLKYIPECRPYFFMVAMLTETPIKLSFLPYTEKEISGYALVNEAKPGDENFVRLLKKVSSPVEEKKEGAVSPVHTIQTNAISPLISQLDAYCISRASRAKESPQGGDYNHAYGGGSGLVGWTAKQQIEKAIEIMGLLMKARRPDFTALKELLTKPGPHQSGSLKIICREIKAFINECESLEYFNRWILAMKPTREVAIKKSEAMGKKTLTLYESKAEANEEDWEPLSSLADIGSPAATPSKTV